MRIRKSRWIFLLLFFLVSLSSCSGALSGEREGQQGFVWRVYGFDGSAYTGTISPPKVSQLYFLAGERNLISANYSFVYYWPITHEYLVDWSRLNERANGTLEILDNDGRLIQQINAEPYLLTNDDFTAIGTDHLLVGREATEHYGMYEELRDKWRTQHAEYTRKIQEYQRALVADPDRTDLEFPQPPEDFKMMLAEPRPGYPVELGEGTYQIQLRDEKGNIVQESCRTVIGVSPRRDSMGYVVIPEERWTKLESSDEPSQVIYFSPQSTAVYLQPTWIKEYNQKEYTRITDPQNITASTDLWEWIKGPVLENVQLQILNEGQVNTQIQKTPYVVMQDRDQALGYKIIPYEQNANSPADFGAFGVSIIPGLKRYEVQVIREDGTIVSGSKRVLLRTSGSMPFIANGITIFPLGVGIYMRWQRWKIRSRSLKELKQAGL